MPSPDTKTFIYGLSDPRDPSVFRYTGRTINPANRMGAHLKDAKAEAKGRSVCPWVKSLLDQNIIPMMTILEETVWECRVARERHWIQTLEASGHPLLNLDNSKKNKKVNTGKNFKSGTTTTNEAIRAGVLAWHERRAEDEKAQAYAKQAASVKAAFAAHTPEQKAAHKAARQLFWKNASPEWIAARTAKSRATVAAKKALATQ